MTQEPLDVRTEEDDAEDGSLVCRLAERESMEVLTGEYSFQRVDFPGNRAVYLIGHCDGEMLVYKCSDPDTVAEHGLATLFDRHGRVHRHDEDFDPYGFIDL